MDKSELEYSIRKSLRKEFETAPQYRQIEIYKTFKDLNNNHRFNFEEDIAETRSDIYADHSIELT